MWRSSRWASGCLLVAVLLLVSSQVVSQGPLINRDVRVRAPSVATFRILGTVDRAVRDTLFVRGHTAKGADTIWTVPASAMTGLQVKNGTRSNAFQGLGLGLLGGAVLGAGLGALSCKDEREEFGPGVCALLGGVAFGGGGAVVGLIVGALTRSDRWVDEPTQPLRVVIDWRNRGGGLRVGATFAF